MTIVEFDIHLELDPATLRATGNPEREMALASRHAAEGHAREFRLKLVDAFPTSILVDKGFNPVSKRNVVLVATRWRAEGEEPLELRVERWRAGAV